MGEWKKMNNKNIEINGRVINIGNTEQYEVGQRWYVKTPGAFAVCEVEISDVTVATIAFKMVSCFDVEERYEWKDITIIEQVTSREDKGE